MNTPMEAKPANLLARIWAHLTQPHPSVHEIGEQRRAQLLAALTLAMTVILILAVLVSPVPLSIGVSFLAVSLLTYALSRSPYYLVGVYFFTFAETAVAYVMIYFGVANSVDAAISSTVPISLIFASAFLPQRGFILLSLLATFAAASLGFYADPRYLTDSHLSIPRTAGMIFSLSVLLFGVTVFRDRIERMRMQQTENANRELETLTAQLEQRVDERTKELSRVTEATARRAAQLETIADVSQALSRLKDSHEILSVASQLISERLGFYHVGVFLVDQSKTNAILQAANSAGGQKMLERGHRLAFGTGVVGFVAQTKRPRIALDVGADAVFFNNPDLPKTRSEIALPLLSDDKLIGVLDAQSLEPNAFSEDDFHTLGVLANQLTVALENMRLLSEARAATFQAETVYNEFIRTQWQRISEQMDYPGFRYNDGRIELLEPDKGTSVAAPAGGATDQRQGQITVPVKLRGETIGLLQVEARDLAKTWQADEIGLIETVAERAAFALENARLFQDARRRAAKERMIAEATTRVSGSTNIENILQATAAELERVLGGSEVLIRFNDKDAT